MADNPTKQEFGIYEAAKKVASPNNPESLGKTVALLNIIDTEYGDKNDKISPDELQKAIDHFRPMVKNSDHKFTGDSKNNQAVKDALADAMVKPFENLKAQLFPPSDSQEKNPIRN